MVFAAWDGWQVFGDFLCEMHEAEPAALSRPRMGALQGVRDDIHRTRIAFRAAYCSIKGTPCVSQRASLVTQYKS